MVRNESVARMVMFLCFGTAILSLAVHWRISATQRQFEKPVFTGNRGSLGGETAFGASTSSVTQTDSTPKSSAGKPHNRVGTVSQNVAGVTDVPKNSVIVGQEQNSTVSKQPKSLFSWASDQQKSSNRMVSMKTEVVVDLSDRRTYVYAGDLVIASYPIAVGKKGWETPIGSFEVKDMQHDPIWRHPITGEVFPAGSDSPLGERWIGFWSDGRNEIGFHGTPDTNLVGSAISHGCLRMRNPDVRLLYNQVNMGTRVIVRD